MSAPPQNNAQPAPIVLTIPTQNDTQSEKEHILKLFPKKTMLTFSIIQLSCAALAAILQLCVIGTSYYSQYVAHVGAGIWAGFFFGISGGVGLVASHRPSNGTIIAFMVLSIISALFALPLLVFAGIGFGAGGHRRTNTFSIICYGIQIVIGLLQGVVAITASAFSCRAVCCGRKQYPGAVIFSPGTNAEQTFTTIPLNQIIQSAAQSAPPVTAATNLVDKEEEKPPAYDSAAAKQPEDGNRYQRFD